MYEQGQSPRLVDDLNGADDYLARERIVKLRDTIQHHLSDNRRGEIMRSGIRLAIFGPPNAGKSSLLNFLGARTSLELR